MINDNQFNRHMGQTSSPSLSAFLRHTKAMNACIYTITGCTSLVDHHSVSCKHHVAGQEGVFFPLSDSLHSSSAVRPIYSKWPELIPMASTSRNGLLHVVSPQKSLTEQQHRAISSYQNKSHGTIQTALLPNISDVRDIWALTSLCQQK